MIFCNATVVDIAYSFLFAKTLHLEFLSLQHLSKSTLSFLTMTSEKTNLVVEDDSLHFLRSYSNG